MKSCNWKIALVHVYGDEGLKFSKTIWSSIKYGLSNERHDIGGLILQLYTFTWIIMLPVPLVIIIPLFIYTDFDLISSIFAYLIILIGALPTYALIYFAWYTSKKQQDKSVIKQDNSIKNLHVPVSSTQKNKGLADSDLRHEKAHEGVTTSQNNVSTVFHENLNISPHTKSIIKSMGNILQNEKIIDAISGQLKSKEKKNIISSFLYFYAPSLVLTSSRIVLYQKNIFGGFYTKDYPINSINGITFHSGLILDGIKLHTKIGNLELGDMPKKIHAEDFVNNVKSCMSSSESRPVTKVNTQTFNKSITRQTEFFQGYIRLKMAITNTTEFVINDVALDFHFDEVLLRIDRHEPDYPIKNGKIIFGNINSSLSKSVAVYFDPMMCSNGTEINCQINYSDAKGQIQTTWMEPKSISVVCPIMKTDSDINIGRLKEFVEKLPHRDSKIYQIHTGFNIDSLKTISQEVIQKHNIKHIRSLYTKDGKTCEIWYYGKTKVNNHDIVIRITISSENQSIELFAATQTAESLTGLLAEFGRELLLAIEDKITGKNNVNQVINVSIKDSIIQRSNLLSYCDIDGKCTGDVIVEDSIVQRSDIGLNDEVNDSFIQKTYVGGSSCPVCGGAVPDGAKFCNECGGELK